MNRLYPAIHPFRYSLTVTPDFSTRTFFGEETITFSLAKPTKELTFHAVEIEITHAELVDQKGSEQVLRQAQEKNSKQSRPARMTPIKITYDKKQGRVTFLLSKKLLPGEYMLKLSYKGILGEKMMGWYVSEFSLGKEKHFIAVTQFEEIGARQAFVCIDEPEAKAVFDVTLIISKHMTGISNTIIEEETALNGHKKLRFSPTPRMSTYLLAFIVGEFESIETTSKNGVQVRAFATLGKKKQLEFALDIAAKCLDFYADYFAISYPLPVLDLIALPDFASGAMENWGAVTFREAALLIDSEKSSLANKQWVALVVAHELAHMWFGNLVTMQWWTHLWLNEGFACYIEYVAISTIFPKWDMWKQFAVTEHASALTLDSLASSHPIEVPIDNENDVKEIFDQISYAKGANVIQMLATFLGANTFRDGLRKYLKDNAYGNTVTEQLWDAFDKISGQPVRKIMQNWTQKTGYPLLTVLKKNGTYFISQERFFASSLKREKNTTKTVWQVPLYILTEKKTEKIVLEDTVTSVKNTSDLIKVNAGETSLVRAVYEDTMYQELGLQIEKKTLKAVDRMGIIRDAFDSAEAGVLSSGAALQLLSWYKNEEEYIVWATIASGLGSLENVAHHIPGVKKEFDTFGRKIFSGIAKKMGWEKKPTDSHTDILLRSIVLNSLGKYGDKATIQKARKLFNDHVSGKKQIDSDIRGVVFALVAKNGNEKEWKTFLDLYQKEELHQEKNRLMMALCSFESKELLEKTLKWSMDKNIGIRAESVRLQDKFRITLLLFANPYAHELTWKFIKKHWSEYREMYKRLHSFSQVIEGAGNIFDKTLRDDIAAFFATNPQEELTRTIAQILEKMDANIVWLHRDRIAIEKFLKNEV